MQTMIRSFDGTQLFLNTETTDSDKAICVMVHGLCEHQGRYDYMAETLHYCQIGTYRFDHRGHGKSEGERTFYNNYEEMLKDVDLIVSTAIEENPQKPIFLLGHSMGGFAVSLYGAKYPDKKIKGIITSGGLTKDNFKLISEVPKDQDPHGLLPNQLGSGVCSVQSVVEDYEKDPLNTKTFTIGLCYAIQNGIKWFTRAKRKFNYPVLILHGEKDGLVSPVDSLQFFEKIASKDKQIKIYGGLFHEIFNEYAKDETIGDVINWIHRRI